MINRMHALWHRPQGGWDPVPPKYASSYAEAEWASGSRDGLLDVLEGWVGGLEGKRILDLGGGAGQYSVAFATRGAEVMWHDVSAVYQGIAEDKAREHGVKISFSLGYMDEAPEKFGGEFDLVFNRICWNYGFTDRSFAQTIYTLVKPGGVGYIDTPHSGWRRESLSTSARLRTWLNDTMAVKIGHPLPPHGRIARLMMKLPIENIQVDYSSRTNDRVIFRKSAS